MNNIVSVIVPCYNQGMYLSEALESILAQSYQDWECVIINDNSNDETEQVAKQFLKRDNRFKYYVLNNKGVSGARNFGVEVTSGDFILPLDADDKISSCYLEKAVSAFIQDPELNLVYGEAEFFGDMSGKWVLPDYSFYKLLFMNMIYCSAIFKRVDFLNVGGYSKEMVHGLEDWDFWLRFLNSKSKVLKLPEVVFFYRKKLVSRSTELMKEGKLEKTRLQLIHRNKEIYNLYTFTILKELAKIKKDNVELERQIKLLKNSKTYRFFSSLKSVKNKLFKFFF